MRIGIIFILVINLLWINLTFGQSATVVGDAVSVGDGCYQITVDQQYQAGAVWFDELIDLTRYVSITVDMNLGNTDNQGADGCILAMQQEGPDALGVTGQFLGFGGISPSFGLEFDTFNNETYEFNGDIASDHLAMLLNGETNHNSAATNIAGPVSILPGGANAENGQNIRLRLVWDPVLQEMKAYMDCNLRLSVNIDLVNEVFGGDPMVYWGFTGATGFYDNLHQACLIEVAYLNPTVSETICEGESIQLELNTEVAENIEWTPEINIDEVDIPNPTVSPSASTTYTATYEKCSEVFTDTFHVEVLSLDIEEIEDISVCPGGSAEFTAVYDPSYTVEWSDGLAGVNTNTFDEIGNHWVEVDDGICTKRENFSLIAFDLPQIVIPSEVEYCFMDSTLVEFSADNSSLFTPDMEPGESFYVSAEGIYEVLAVDEDTGCENTAQVQAVEIPLPQLTIAPQYEICPYEQLDLTTSSTYTTNWSNGQIGTSATYSEGGAHSVTSELNGCTSSANFLLIVNPLPNSSIPGEYEFCEDSVFVIGNTNPNYQVEWYNGLVMDSLEFTEEGMYDFEIMDVNTGCVSPGQITLTRVLNPTLVMESEYLLCEEEELEIRPEIENATSTVWSTGTEDIMDIFFEPGEFEFTISNQCTSISQPFVVNEVVCECQPFIPLAFTPDNDGINDLFKPILTCEPFEYNIRVFNRWGEIVFESNDFKKPWDGSHLGGTHYVPAGVYSYTLSYKSEQFDGNKLENRNGMISVIR